MTPTDLAFLAAAALIALVAAIRCRVWFVPALGFALFAANTARYHAGGQSYWVAVEMAAGSLHPDTLSSGRWWELVAYSWLHWDFDHLSNNLRSILVAGVLVELALGWRRTALIWTVAVVLSGVAIGLIELAEPEAYGLGASAGAFAFTGALVVLLVSRRLDGMPPDIHMMWVMPGLTGSLLNSLAPDVSLTGHLGGLVVGLAASALLVWRGGARFTAPALPVNWWLVAASPFMLGGVGCGWPLFYGLGLLMVLGHLLTRPHHPPEPDAAWVRRAAPLCLVLLLAAPAVAWSVGEPWKLVPSARVTYQAIPGSAARLAVPEGAWVDGPLTADLPLHWTAGGVRGEVRLVPFSDEAFVDEVRTRVAALEERGPMGGEFERDRSRCVAVTFQGLQSRHGRHRISVLEDQLLIQTVWFAGAVPQAVVDLVKRLDEHPCRRRGPAISELALGRVAYEIGDLGYMDGLFALEQAEPELQALAGLRHVQRGEVVDAAETFSDLAWDEVPRVLRIHAAREMATDEGSVLSMPELAHRLARQATEENAEDPVAWDVRAMAEARMGDFEAAVAHEEKAVALAPEDWRTPPRRYRVDLFRAGQPWTRGMRAPPEPKWTLDLGFFELGSPSR